MEKIEISGMDELIRQLRIHNQLMTLVAALLTTLQPSEHPDPERMVRSWMETIGDV